ncbi:MAG: hypothetical protein J1E62_05245 [Lachnospiraceae bacterium]|nr:hypothetical protein [Lachnospiraceae bacterium]
MGFLDKFKKKTEDKKTRQGGNKELLTELVRILSDNNSEIKNEMERCLSDAKSYYDTHTDLFSEWGLAEYSDGREIYLITLVDLLEKANIVCIRDYKDEKEDFIYFVQNLTGYKNGNLSLEEDWLQEDGDITVWAEVLGQHWDGYELAAIDMDSDSYVLFVCDANTLAELMRLGENTGIHIDLAKNM